MEHIEKYTRRLKLSQGLIKFLEEDSILLTEETIEFIEKETREAIQEVIDEFGSVFIKLNNKAPTDAYFLVHNLRCFSLDDILILLKGSGRITYHNGDNYLTIKKWITIEEQEEFRCFLIDKQLKGICQRQCNVVLDYNKDDLIIIQNKICDKIQTLNTEMGNTIVDLAYLNGRVKILDIENKSNDDTNSLLLFNTWGELQNSSEIIIKCVQSPEEILEDEGNLNQFPIELIGTDINTLIQSMSEI